MSPRACLKPARIAECCPKFRASSTTRTRPSSAAAISRRMPSESSREPSSMKIVSHGRSRPSSTGFKRDHSEPRFADSLNTGTTIDTNPRSARDTAEVLRIGDILPGELKGTVRDLVDQIRRVADLILADSPAKLKTAPFCLLVREKMKVRVQL